MCVVSFLFGDILGIQELFLLLGLSVVLSILLLILVQVKYWAIIVITTVGVLGFVMGYHALQNKMNEYSEVERYTEGFTKKGTFRGEVQKRVYRKERSNVYLVNIDNFDNFDKNNRNPSVNRKSDDYFVDISSSGGKKGKITIFIEVPSNLSVSPGDVVEFNGTIKQNIEFPLKGYNRYAFLHGGYGSIFLPNFTVIIRGESGYFTKIHEKWEKVFTSSFPREVSGILLGMTIGSTNYLREDVKDAFQKSGITHILVVSGSNIAFLILFLTFFTKYIHFQKWVNASIIIASVVFYVFLVGIEIPVIRAAIMGILGFSIATAGLKSSGKAIIGITGVILTIIEPLSPIFDAGFGLSFGATLGILLFHKQTEQIFSRFRIPPIIRGALALTIGASIGSLPVLIYHFGSLPINTILTNVLVAGFLGWILFMSTFFGMLSLISLPFLKIAGLLVYIPTKMIIGISSFLSHGIIIQFSPEIGNSLSLLLIGFVIFFYISLDTKEY